MNMNDLWGKFLELLDKKLDEIFAELNEIYGINIECVDPSDRIQLDEAKCKLADVVERIIKEQTEKDKNTRRIQ